MPLAFALALAYAVVRYLVVKGVPLAHAPLYVTNKAVAALALVAFARAVSHADPGPRRTAARQGLTLSGVHALASLPLLTPAYFPAWFAPDGRYLLRAETALALGAASLALAWHVSRTGDGSEQALRDVTRSRLVTVALAWAHCTAVGLPNWLDPAAWPGYLPPITMLCALGTAPLLAFALRRAARPDPR
jgi:hypothetical protein